MRVEDPVYGPADIIEPVLLALIESPAVQRLTQILQHGISGLIGITAPITRFDHSLGVMILVSRLRASVEERIAALLHDISHTAFSHVIDYVVDGHDSQSYHDEKKEEYLSRTELPDLLRHYGYDWRDFLEESRFPLLEQPSPRLCADRLDYFLRDSLALGLATEAEVRSVLGHLVVHDGRIVVDDLDVARWLGNTYLAADDASWANFDEVGVYELTAQAIKIGLDVGVVSEADFWGTDQHLWAKLHAGRDPRLQAQLNLIRPDARFVWDEGSPTFWVSTKLRTIDPDVLVDGRPRPLSVLDSDFARRRQAYLTGKAGKWPMRLLS
ncbi:MAG: HD domain-containing protein [Anaerolineae bacterium]